MKNVRKMLLLSLCVMALGLTACGMKGDNKTVTDGNTAVDSTTDRNNTVNNTTDKNNTVNDATDGTYKNTSNNENGNIITDTVEGVGEGVRDVTEGVTEGVRDTVDGVDKGINNTMNNTTNNNR